MANTVTVYPQEGRTYPDALGVPITAVGATVSESEYILDAIASGYLLTEDPLGVNDPDDRVDGVTDAPANAQYLTLATDGTLTQERVLTAGVGVSFVDTGAGGTLTINASGGGALAAYDTAAALSPIVGTAGDVAATLGAATVGDKGGGLWYWAAGSSATANVGTVLGSSGSGRWLRLYSGALHARWFGATGDGATDDSTELQAWLDALPLGGEGYLNKGSYRVTQPLTINQRDCRIVGEGSGIHSAVGAKLVWAGASAAVFLLTCPWYGTVIEYVHFECSTNCLGFVEFGSISGSLSSRCRLKNVAMLGSSAVGAATFTYGCAIGYTTPGAFNMEYMHFEEVYVANALDSAFYVGGTANCLGHTWVRCIVTSGMGVPGERAYVAAGLSDGIVHPYGRGIHLVGGNQISLHQCNFGYLESWITFSSTDRDFINVHEMDSEHCKKAIVGAFSTQGHVTVTGTRAVLDKVEVSSIGPVGYAALDHKYLEVSGLVGSLNIQSCSLTKADGHSTTLNKCISAPIIVAMGSTFSGPMPFLDPGNETKVYSFGNMASNGAGATTSVLSGAYKLHVGGFFPEPMHFDAIQTVAPDFNAYNYNITTGDPIPQSSTRRNTVGTVTISDANTFTAVLFSISELSTSYVVRLTPVSTTGTPAAGSLVAMAASKTTLGFSATATAAPGVGSSVTFLWEIVAGYGL